MKLFELVIDEEKEDSGVLEIALVDVPAIESNWVAFNKYKAKFKIENEEKRIISGWAMKADLPIPRIDEETGERFQVIFRKDTIEKIVHKYMREDRNNHFNIMHTQQSADGVYLIESVIRDSKRGTKAPDNFEDAPDGSWWISARVESEEVWQQVKDGTFQGFSVEGFFGQTKPKDIDEEKLEEIREIVRNFVRSMKSAS